MSSYQNLDIFPTGVELIKSIDISKNDKLLIWGLDTDSRSNLAIVDNYRPSFYIQLDHHHCKTSREWLAMAVVVKEWLLKQITDLRPVVVEEVIDYKLQYYQPTKTRFLRLYYTNIAAAERAVSLFKWPKYVKYENYNLGQIQFTLHEENFNEYNLSLRLTSEKNCKFTYSGWQVMSVTPVREEARISKRAIEWRVDYSADVPASTVDISPNPTVLSFDIETATPDYEKFMPKAEILECTCYQITYYFGRLGTPREQHRRRIVIVADHTINKELTDRNVEVINIADESTLIDTHCQTIEEFDPDVITGFNIIYYDNTYLVKRGLMWNSKWSNCSRLIDAEVMMHNMDFSMIRDKYIMICPGRITVDVFTYAYKNLKLKYYSLSAVAYNQLKESKRDVPYEEQFVAYNTWTAARYEVDQMIVAINPDQMDPNFKTAYFNRLKRIVEASYQHYIGWMNANSPRLIEADPTFWITGIETMIGVAVTILEQLQSKKACYRVPDNRAIAKYIVGQHLLYRVMDYGDQDAYLPYHLFEKLGIFLNVALMAKVNYVNPEQIYTRGKQICCQSMIYVTAKKLGYIVDRRVPIKYHIGGGHVQEPDVGYWKKVATLDFNSLYPSVILDKNLCYCTLIAPGGIPPNLTEDDYEVIVVPVPKHEVEYTYRWVKKHIRPGVLVILETRLMGERKAVRIRQRSYPFGSLQWSLLENEQNALKVACNSVYGFLGVGCNLDKDRGAVKNVNEFEARQYVSKMPLPEASNCITFCGRSYIQRVMAILKEWYPDVHVVYGDTDSAMFYIPSITSNYIAEYKKIEARLNAVMPENLVLEMENVSDIVLYGKKNYVKFMIGSDDQPKIDERTGKQEAMAKGVPKARRDRSKALVEVHSYVTDAIHAGMDNIQLYRWIITYIIDLIRPGRDMDCYEIIKNYNSAKDGGNKTIVKRMKAYGKEIESGDRFGYVIADIRMRDVNGKVVRGAKRPKKCEAAFELSIYTKLQNEGKAPPIDYFYYVDALVKPIDKIMKIVKRLPEPYRVIRYKKPRARDTTFFIDQPMKLIASMVDGGETRLDVLLNYFDEITMELGL